MWQAIRDGRYDPGRGALSTFVYAVAMKIWLRERRRSARQPDPADELADRLLSAEGDMADAAALAELLRRVQDYLADPRLPEEDRHVLGAVSRGVSDRDLARELGVVPSTAHERKSSALKRLRRWLFPGPQHPSAERRGHAGEEQHERGPTC